MTRQLAPYCRRLDPRLCGGLVDRASELRPEIPRYKTGDCLDLVGIGAGNTWILEPDIMLTVIAVLACGDAVRELDGADSHHRATISLGFLENKSPGNFDQIAHKFFTQLVPSLLRSTGHREVATQAVH
ncbi:hypothetical protein CC117_25495 [Parafrankia colletiae]|uniref:Uncharacterized protein n=1 Tax=Parafrankia colletiae TaxID=573497 RepID=A0A1S1QDM7_9ACTN|nr:hypothetical protein CC117_25495 [Parafrankia colletiae]